MKINTEETIARLYYHVKPFLSRKIQIMLRSLVARQKRAMFRDRWPIDPNAGVIPSGFQGWPGGKRFSFVLTHDVDTARGVARCEQLMNLEGDLGFRSSFNFVAHDYHLPEKLRHKLVEEGFEIGVHGLEHNRKLYESVTTFAEHAKQINEYLREWGAVGFRSPCVYHNFEWLHALDISYEASAFDTDPFEPQSDALGTIFPIHQTRVPGREYVVLPYTLPQDFTLFILFRETNIDVWKKKLAWVAEQGGMALLITHPDYMSFDAPPAFDEYDPELYRELLRHVTSEYPGQYWHALPHEVATFWNLSYPELSAGSGDEISISSGEQGVTIELAPQLVGARPAGVVEGVAAAPYSPLPKEPGGMAVDAVPLAGDRDPVSDRRDFHE